MKVVLLNLTKKTIACFLAVIIAMPLISVPTTAYGASFSDIRGHWAESYINKAVSSGFVKGYPDGDFRPDNAVTRAEFTSMVNKALGNTGTAAVNFKDVPYNEWYYSDVAKGMSAAFVGGYDDNTFRPNNSVTREEAAVMISRFVPTYGSTGNTSTFKDRLSISTWASDAVSKIYGKGYMGAYDDGKYHPQDSLTRAQAAKIMCSILDKETIVSASTTVKSKGTTLSGRIYSNNVTMHADLGTGEADISNSVVLGTLYVYGGGNNTITISNSRIANAQVEKSSSSVRLLAKGQTVINKVTTGNTAILETSGLNGGLSGTGYNQVDIKSSANTTLRGSFAKVNIIGSSADVNVESGSITTLNVTSSGRNSVITLNSKASIGTADVNAAAAFKGSGTINTMNVNSSGVTYETKPKYVKIGSGISNPDYDDDDDDYDIKVDPKSGSKNVKLSTEITLTFDTAVKKYSGSSTIKNSDIPDMIYLRKGSSSGSKVAYSGSISSNKKEITLTPDDDLEDDTKYYVVIGKNEFRDTHDKGNSSQTTYFTTGDESDDMVTFSPKSKSTGVSQTVRPTITFSESVETYGGKDITDSYLSDSVIIFREETSNGSKVSFEAEMSSSRKINIRPKSSLKEGKKYYLGIANKKFRTKNDETNIEDTGVTWTVEAPSAPTVGFSPGNGATGVPLASTITLNFSSSIYNTSGIAPIPSYLQEHISLRNDTTQAGVAFSASITNNVGGAVVVIKPSSPLTAGNKYTVSVPSGRFRNNAAVYLNSASATFTAVTNADLTKLEAAIAAASNAKAGVRVSVNGADVLTNVYWVTQAQLDALNAAIDVANNVRSTALTTAQADAAAVTLTTATSTFTAAKKLGTKIIVDTSSITLAIEQANAAKSGVKVSSDGFDVPQKSDWVTQNVMNDLTTAIDIATRAIDTVKYPSEAFDAAVALKNATTTFRNSKQQGKQADKGALNTALKAARSNILSVTISSDGTDVPSTDKWVTQPAFSEYENVISRTGGIADSSNVTQVQVDQALSDLGSATSTFNGAKKDGTKPPDPPGGGGETPPTP